MTVADADKQLQGLRRHAAEDDCHPHQLQQQPGPPLGVVEMIETARHAHETQHVGGHEREIKAHQPAPEGDAAQLVVQAETERLGEPIRQAGHIAEHRATDDHVVKVRDQEQAVVQQEVGARHRQQHPGHAADAEGHDKAQGPQHGRFEAHAAAVHGEQPGEDFHPGRHRDDHRHDAEERVDVAPRAHGEKVMQPHDERQHGDRDGRPYQRHVAEQPLAAEGGGNLGKHPERGQDQDVHLRMPPGPDEVHVHHRVAAGLVGEKMHAQIAVQGQHQQGGGEDRECRQNQHRGAQRVPGEHRHLEQRHAFGAHLQDGDEEIHPREQRADAGYLQ